MFYRPKPVWEDIDLIHDIIDADLAAVKCYRFTHVKVNHQRTKESECDDDEVWQDITARLPGLTVATTDCSSVKKSARDYNTYLRDAFISDSFAIVCGVLAGVDGTALLPVNTAMLRNLKLLATIHPGLQVETNCTNGVLL